MSYRAVLSKCLSALPSCLSGCLTDRFYRAVIEPSVNRPVYRSTDRFIGLPLTEANYLNDYQRSKLKQTKTKFIHFYSSRLFISIPPGTLAFGPLPKRDRSVLRSLLHISDHRLRVLLTEQPVRTAEELDEERAERRPVAACSGTYVLCSTPVPARPDGRLHRML